MKQTGHPAKDTRTVKRAIALLSDPEFTADVEALHITIGWADGEGAREQAIQAAEQERTRKREAFKVKWGPIVPPPDAMIHPDPCRPEASALLSGRWGMIRVFPYTTEADVKRDFRRIRGVIGRAKREARNAHRASLAQWLADCGFSSREIVTAVWGRKKGLRRLSKQQINSSNRHLVKVDELVGRLGERAAYAAVQGSEAPATAMARVARARYAKSVKCQREEFKTPLKADPLSCCIMKIVRLKFPTSPIPFVPAVESIAPHLEPLLDELRALLLAPPSA